jgi:hypothetical protein
MGIFTAILTLPLAPVRGTVWVAELLAEEADRELQAAHSPQRALAELEAARAAGELTDEEFAEAEEELVDAMLALHTFEEVR